jgi:hypothetical protein
MYLGTGWSLVLFSFPAAGRLRPDNYYNQFVPEVTAATKFFTVMTSLMLAAGGVMIAWEPVDWQRVFPAIVLASTVAATTLTLVWIVPLNRILEAGISGEEEFRSVLGRWMQLNWVRVAFWTLEWVAMAAWLGVKLT